MDRNNMFRVWDKVNKEYCEYAWVIEGASGNLCSLLTNMHLDMKNYLVEHCTGYVYNDMSPIYYNDLVKTTAGDVDNDLIWEVKWDCSEGKITLRSLSEPNNYTPMSKRLSFDYKYNEFSPIFLEKVGTIREGLIKK